MKKIILILPLLFGCATIMKSGRGSTAFIAPDDTEVKVQTPDGNFTVNGTTTILLTNSKADIPIQITCNQKTKNATVPTHFDVAAGGLGNLVFGGIFGWVIDGVGNKAYDPAAKFNLAPYCESPRATASEAK